jgi:hypothetical protein
MKFDRILKSLFNEHDFSNPLPIDKHILSKAKHYLLPITVEN